jgi:hypothetical protein
MSKLPYPIIGTLALGIKSPQFLTSRTTMAAMLKIGRRRL